MGKPRIHRLEDRKSRVGLLRVIDYKERMYYCYCDCGILFWTQASNVNLGLTKSCGCLRKGNCGAVKYVRLTAKAKAIIDWLHEPYHPVFGITAMSEWLGYEMCVVRDYIKSQGKSVPAKSFMGTRAYSPKFPLSMSLFDYWKRTLNNMSRPFFSRFKPPNPLP